jgi:hypothetical protein
MRWLVERSTTHDGQTMEDVGAERMVVLPCGALQFYNGSLFEPKDIILFAPGAWLTVCEAPE